MNETHDEHLWTGEGSPSADVAALEAELGTLRWQPRALELQPQRVSNHDPRDEVARVVSIATPRTGPRWSPMLIAGFAAAAAIFMLVFWLQRPAPSAAPERANPAARPLSPDLKDPFASSGASEQPGFTSPITDREQPPGASKVVSPDLKDPFADSTPKPKRRVSPDLKDPFAGQPKRKQVSPDLTDPFKGAPTPIPEQPGKGKHVSPDLKDPFASD